MEFGTLSNCSVFSSFPQLFGTLYRRFHSARRNANEAVPKGDITVAYWLMKSEPESYGWADLVRDGGTEWDGVRNNAARLHLKAMKKGDEAFFYHSMSDKAVVGIIRVTREAKPDPKDPDWVSVRVEPVRPLARPVTLAEIKAEPKLAKMELIRQSRLSVAPVRDEEWQAILEMAKS
jgi:predicted RNA-binding protein with PUA-like domain